MHEDEFLTQMFLHFSPDSCKFVPVKQTLKHIVSLAAVLFALYMSVDDSISFFADSEVVQVPMASIPDGAHHQHVSFTDHFFQKNTDSHPDCQAASTIQAADHYHYTPGTYLSAIWQPPKSSC